MKKRKIEEKMNILTDSEKLLSEDRLSAIVEAVGGGAGDELSGEELNQIAGGALPDYKEFESRIDSVEKMN